MPAIAERLHTTYEALAEVGGECRASGTGICARPAVVRIATETTFSGGVPVTHLIGGCGPHARAMLARPIQGVTTAHVHAYPETPEPEED